MTSRLAFLPWPLLIAAQLAATPAPASAAPKAAATAPASPPVLVLGLIPQAPPVAMHERWTPFAERLSALAGVRVELKLYEDMMSFEKDYQAGGPDLIFSHPSMAADAHLRQGFVPLLRDRTEITGILFVRKDSPLRSISDLVGKKVAFVGAKSFCALITKDLLTAEQADISFQEQNTGSTRNVMKAVVLGKADAGASLDVSAEAEPAELRAELRPLATTRPMAPHPISAHPRVAEAVRARITAAVLAMAAAPADRALLSSVRLKEPITADYDRDYRSLERPTASR